MATDDLHYALARNIAHVIPGLDEETYLRAARGAATMWRSEWHKGYHTGKENGLMESSQAGEIAGLRERLRRAETHVCPDPASHNIRPTEES